MHLKEVTEILADLREAGCRAWVAGGWGVDALVGGQTRPHRDLDLAMDGGDVPSAIVALEQRGYRVETDWRPVRVDLACVGVGWVDVHPVVFDQDGHGRQAGSEGACFDYPPTAFDTGSLGATQVACLSRQQQLTFHTGYEPRPVDLHDLELLNALEQR